MNNNTTLGTPVREVIWESVRVGKPLHVLVDKLVDKSLYDSKWNQLWEPVRELARIQINITL
jgi:hypothetical protein